MEVGDAGDVGRGLSIKIDSRKKCPGLGDDVLNDRGLI